MLGKHLEDPELIVASCLDSMGESFSCLLEKGLVFGSSFASIQYPLQRDEVIKAQSRQVPVVWASVTDQDDFS